MAKKDSKGRVRVFFAEIEGDDETIQDGLKAMATAVGKTFQPTTVVKYLPSQNGNAIDSEALNLIEETPVENEDDALDEEFSTRERKPTKKRKPPKMSLVKTLNLIPEGKKSFRDFVEEKNPTSQMEQVTVSVYYLKKILDLENVTADYVYTCLDHADLRIPNDLPQIIRNTASRKGWVETGEDDILLTTMGKNHVEHDLPKAAKK